jgi:hypothetical protein
MSSSAPACCGFSTPADSSADYATAMAVQPHWLCGDTEYSASAGPNERTSIMAMTDAQRQEAAEALFHAELTREWIEPITLTYDGADIDDAYAIGQCVTDLKGSAGRV